MNPQEKGKELISLFRGFAEDCASCSHDCEETCQIRTMNAKQCALICVEEIISSYEKTKEADRSLIPVYNYWQSVLEAIKQIK